MDATLFVNNQDIYKYSQLSGNFDVDKLNPYIKIAQDIEVQSVLGTVLYDKLISDIDGDTLAGYYLTLVTDYIQPMLIQYAMADLIQFHGYEIANAGVLRNFPENTQLPDIAELNTLTQRHRNNAEGYRQRLINQLCLYPSRYPEYNAAQTDGDYPNTASTNYSSPWNL